MRSLLIPVLFACAAAGAQPLALPPPPDAGLAQHIGARVPLDAAVTDEAGRRRYLAELVDGTRPVLLVPGYYRCARLCGLVMRGLLQALDAGGAPRAQWRIVGIGIDPDETPADARARHALDAGYAASLPGSGRAGPLDLQLLSLQAAERDRILSAVGFRLQRTQERDATGFAHPATVVLLTPGGTVARYFNGIGADAGALRIALADAAGDRLGSATARLAVLCTHLDPQVGRLDAPVMNAVRAVCLLGLAGLAGWCWRRRGTRPGGHP